MARNITTLRAKLRDEPSQTYRSTRLPSSGVWLSTAVSASVELSVQYRYTPGLAGKSGCRAIPSSPRSDPEFTARSRTVPCTTPSTTRWTRPVAFSSTSMSLAARKARLVGWLKPSTTVRTPRLGSSITGPLDCASDGLPGTTPITRPAVASSPNTRRTLRDLTIVVPPKSSLGANGDDYERTGDPDCVVAVAPRLALSSASEPRFSGGCGRT